MSASAGAEWKRRLELPCAIALHLTDMSPKHAPYAGVRTSTASDPLAPFRQN